MTTQIINNECWLSVNLNLLVQKRAEIQGIILTEVEIDELANEMRMRATLDFLFEEVDNLLLVWGHDNGQYSPEWHYDEKSVAPPKYIKYDRIEGHGWELNVPQRPDQWVAL